MNRKAKLVDGDENLACIGNQTKGNLIVIMKKMVLMKILKSLKYYLQEHFPREEESTKVKFL